MILDGAEIVVFPLILCKLIKEAANLHEKVEHRLTVQVEDVGVEDLVLVLRIQIEQARRLAPGKEALLLHAEAQVEIFAVILVAQGRDEKLDP